MRLVKFSAAILALAMAQSAGAESLKLGGLYPALAADTSDIKSIVIDRFQGDVGEDVSIFLRQVLEQVEVDETPYFMISNSAAARQPDAILTGFARTFRKTTKTTGTRKRCVARDDKGKCTEKKNVKVPCKTLSISFESEFRLMPAGGGQPIYRASKPDSYFDEACEGEGFSSNLITAEKRFVEKAVSEVRRDIAPEWREESISILESAKGMDAAGEREFKSAVKLTKRDPERACSIWQGLASRGVRHRSLSFNLGLCAEQAGDLSKAMNQYQATQEDFESKGRVKDAFKRVGDKRRALAEWQSRLQPKVAAQ